MRRAINIAMSIDAASGADLAHLYRAGLAQIALALANGKHQGTLHIDGSAEGQRHNLSGVFTVEPQQPRPTTTPENFQ